MDLLYVAPAINLAVLPGGFATASGPSTSVPPSSTIEAIATIQPAVAAYAPAPAPAPKPDWTFRLELLWISGCLVVLLQSIVAFRELRRFKIHSRRPDDSWIALFTHMQRELSLSRSVDLRMSINPGPLTCGILRQVILLPADAGAWPLARRRLVLAHEMAHAKRRDGLGQLLCQLASATYWFNPLVWYAVRQLRVERERACDDFVLGLGECAPDYADSLLQIARGLNAGIHLTAVSMACPSQLKSRVIAILNSKIRRKRMSKLSTAALVFGTATLTFGAGAVRVTAIEATPLPARLMPAPPQEPSPGYVVNRSPLSYPVEAIQKRIEGSVVVDLNFNERGEITDSRILSGRDELRQAALQTALQGKYSINTARSLQVIVDFTFDNVKLGNQQQVRLNFALRDEGGAGIEIVSLLPPQAEPIRPVGFFTFVESVDIRGLQEPLLTELRQKFVSFPGLLITTDLLTQARDTIRASSWGQKPVGFMVNPRTANGSDLLITFYESSSSTARVRIGGNVLAAMLVNQVKPVYPQDAKALRIQGVVVLEIDIGPDGTVTGTRVITGHPLLAQAAIEAVRQWVYKPIMLDGQAVTAVSTVTLNFAFQQ